MTDKEREETRIRGLEQLDSLSTLIEKPADNTEAYRRKLEDLGVAILELHFAHQEIVGLIDYLEFRQYHEESLAVRLRLEATVLIGGNDAVNDHNARLLLVDAARADMARIEAGRPITELTSTRDRVALAIDQLEACARELRTALQEMTVQQVAKCARDREALKAGTRCVRVQRDPREFPDSSSAVDDIVMSRAENDFEILRRQIRQAKQS